jgi:hypothetical protein
MRYILRVSIYCAFIAISFPTITAQPIRLFRLPSLEEVPAPISASLQNIESESGELSEGVAFVLYRWDRFPRVFVLDMADFAAQDRMFSRLSFYLEKRGYRGRLLSDAQLAGKHGWNAHDYGPDGLASFFTAATAVSFPLGAEELLLRGIALREGIISRDRAVFVPGSGAILSISRSSSKYERILLLAHESYHGIYFCSEEYRALCDRLWKAAPATERLFMTRLLGALGYDTADRDLVVNEFQAYLLQQPRSMAAVYFERVGKLVAEVGGAPNAAEVLPSLLKDEAVLEDFLKLRFSVEAGGVIVKAEAGR